MTELGNDSDPSVIKELGNDPPVLTELGNDRDPPVLTELGAHSNTTLKMSRFYSWFQTISEHVKEIIKCNAVILNPQISPLANTAVVVVRAGFLRDIKEETSMEIYWLNFF